MKPRERERERKRVGEGTSKEFHVGKLWITSGIKVFLEAIQVFLYRWQKTNVWKKLQPSHFFYIFARVIGVLHNLKILKTSKRA